MLVVSGTIVQAMNAHTTVCESANSTILFERIWVHGIGFGNKHYAPFETLFKVRKVAIELVVLL
jgi:hypothetical protein